MCLTTRDVPQYWSSWLDVLGIQRDGYRGMVDGCGCCYCDVDVGRGMTVATMVMVVQGLGLGAPYFPTKE